MLIQEQDQLKDYTIAKKDLSRVYYIAVGRSSHTNDWWQVAMSSNRDEVDKICANSCGYDVIRIYPVTLPLGRID